MIRRYGYPVSGNFSAALLREGSAAGRIARGDYYGNPGLRECLPYGFRTSNLTDADLASLEVQLPGGMQTIPDTLTIDVSGASGFTVYIEDPDGTIPAGTQAFRLDSEMSTDGGQSWRNYGVDRWDAGQTLTTKAGAAGIRKHYSQERARIFQAQPDGTMLLVSSVYPAGTMFRYHVRQRQGGRLGLSAEIQI